LSTSHGKRGTHSLPKRRGEKTRRKPRKPHKNPGWKKKRRSVNNKRTMVGERQGQSLYRRSNYVKKEKPKKRKNEKHPEKDSKSVGTEKASGNKKKERDNRSTTEKNYNAGGKKREGASKRILSRRATEKREEGGGGKNRKGILILLSTRESGREPGEIT